MDAMEVDLVKVNEATVMDVEDHVEFPGSVDVNAIAQRGMIDFSQIRSVRDFKDCLRNIAGRSNSRLRSECVEILKRSPDVRQYGQRNVNFGGGRAPTFGGQRRQPVRANQVELVHEPVQPEMAQAMDEMEEAIPTINTLGKRCTKRFDELQSRFEWKRGDGFVDTGAHISTSIVPCAASTASRGQLAHTTSERVQ